MTKTKELIDKYIIVQDSQATDYKRDFDTQKECFYLLKEWLEKRMDE